MLPRELKMTVVCRDCGCQFGRWRPRCPSCGTHLPVEARIDPPSYVKTKAHRRREVKSQCAFCLQPGAHEKCPHCECLVHRDCLEYHRAPCLTFQLERDRLATKETASVTQ